jgi:two-component system, LytTR family, sensor kinase
LTEPTRKDAVSGRRIAILVVAGATGLALLSFWYRYSDVLARGSTEPFQIKLIEEFTGVYGAALLLVPVAWLTWRLRRRGVSAAGQLGAHLAGAAAFAAAHTTFLWGSRSILFPLAGLGAYDYGEMPMRYAMELGIQLPVYALTVLGTLALEQRRRSREQELRLVRLEGELARARLTNLEHQLRPHFLFNALNTVSSVMYEDRDRADRLLADLSRFLRRSLRSTDAQQVTLAEELENLELFLSVARARFEERLDVRVEAGEEVSGAAVPSLVLQPLVENGLRHGDPGEDRPIRVLVSARQEEAALVLAVEDDGPGADATLDVLSKRGIGLGNTCRRLELLYPGAHRFEVDNRPEGGFRVRIRIPFRLLEPSASNVGR